jgi:hypothetical protein
MLAIVSSDSDGSLREPPFQKGFIEDTPRRSGSVAGKSDVRTWGLARGRNVRGRQLTRGLS